MTSSYPADMTLREARTRYFQDNQFGEDGGYGDAWVDFKLGPLPMPFPNTAGRVKAVRYHDLHHIVTGYQTDTLGEFEISAWEIGAGCKKMWAAWVLNLSGMAAGALVAPGRIYRAFARGLSSNTLYDEELDAQLERTVGEVRAERVPEGEARRGIGVAARFAATAVVGLVTMSVLTMVVLPLVPVGLLAGVWKRPTAA